MLSTPYILPSQSQFPTNSHCPSTHTARLPTHRSVYRLWQSVSINVQSLSPITLYCQHPTVYQQWKATTKKGTRVLFNFELRSSKYCYSGKAVIIFVALVNHRSMRMRPIAIRGPPRSTTLPHNLINCTIFEIKLLNTKCVFLIFTTIFCETFTFLTKNGWDMMIMYICLHLKYILVYPMLMTIEFSNQVLEKF